MWHDGKYIHNTQTSIELIYTYVMFRSILKWWKPEQSFTFMYINNKVQIGNFLELTKTLHQQILSIFFCWYMNYFHTSRYFMKEFCIHFINGILCDSFPSSLSFWHLKFFTSLCDHFNCHRLWTSEWKKK